MINRGFRRGGAHRDRRQGDRGGPGSGFLAPIVPPVKPVALSIRSAGKLITTSIQVVPN